MTPKELHLRDPFVLTVGDTYYLYGSPDAACLEAYGLCFVAYKSRDLQEWEGPIVIFRPAEDFWAERDFWAPEVHSYQGAFYLFASFISSQRQRGTQIFRAESPEGPFLPISSGPVTPEEWGCLDGTLFVDPKGDPYMVFCHEWTQVGDGEMCAVPLSADLRRPVGEPFVLFRASEPAWANPTADFYVTDGPFLQWSDSGELLLFWSSLTSHGYVEAVSRASDGTLRGEWRHDPVPLFQEDGGHGMVFLDRSGRKRMVLHAPNRSPEERPVFYTLLEQDGRLFLEP